MVAGATLAVFWCPWIGDWNGVQAMRAHRKGDLQTAEGYYRRALARGSDASWIWSNLAMVYAEMGRQSDHEHALDELRKVDPSRAVELMNEINPPEKQPAEDAAKPDRGKSGR